MQAFITYRLPKQKKSVVYERLFGRASRKSEGELSKYIVSKPSRGEIGIRKGNLTRVLSVLKGNNVRFEINPNRRGIKHASYQRQQRRLRAARLLDHEQWIRFWKTERGVMRHVPDAKPEINWYSRKIDEEKQALERLRTRQSPAWVVAYCKGKASAYVMRRRRAYVHRESLNTVVKALRSILKWGVITRRDIESQLEKIADEITESEEAVRLTRLTSRLGFNAHWVKQRAQVRLQKFGIVY